jgi:NAD(P)-dependent dehydrogenase (short-subunit alcohol dehydrogenase family)
MFEESRGNFGPIDILVNNAGLGTVGLLIDHSVEDWEKSMNVNLRGTFLCSRAAAKEMIARKRGRMINIASIAGKEGEEFIAVLRPPKISPPWWPFWPPRRRRI